MSEQPSLAEPAIRNAMHNTITASVMLDLQCEHRSWLQRTWQPPEFPWPDGAYCEVHRIAAVNGCCPRAARLAEVTLGAALEAITGILEDAAIAARSAGDVAGHDRSALAAATARALGGSPR